MVSVYRYIRNKNMYFLNITETFIKEPIYWCKLR